MTTCEQCGKSFESRRAKIFCSLGCYVKSDRFKANRERALVLASAAPRNIVNGSGEQVPCLECGKVFYRKPSLRTHKFCSVPCHRSYRAKRFDRWIANPEKIPLPQCYDEFLDSDTLRCLVDGCNWEGQHLTMHMNMAHGVPTDAFKRAAGFNQSTGVVSKSLREDMSKRDKVGVAVSSVPGVGPICTTSNRTRCERSLEHKEHAKKGRALASPGPSLTCKRCGVVFVKKSTMGRAMYCSKKCWQDDYSEHRRKDKPPKTRIQADDGTFRWVAK